LAKYLADNTITAVIGTRVLSEEKITTGPSNKLHPAIYCGRVVWEDYRNETTNGIDIYLANLDVVCETTHKSLPMAQILKILGLYPKE